MATQTKSNPVETATERVTELNEKAAERFAEFNEKAAASGRKASAAYLGSYESGCCRSPIPTSRPPAPRRSIGSPALRLRKRDSPARSRRRTRAPHATWCPSSQSRSGRGASVPRP